jgi:pimeloyl-ACP methyl ester carboxylesterase
LKTDFFTCTHDKGSHRMAYAEWGARSDNPSIICVHGLTRNGRDFDRLAEALAAAGRHVICPDIVGRGKSDWLHQPELYSYGTYAADIMALLADKKITQVDWVGTSMGGILGMMVASAKETPIRRLVINDVGTIIPLVALQRIATYVALVVEFADKEQLERYIRQIYEPFGIEREEDWQHMLEHSYRILPNGKLALAHDPAIAKNFATLKEDVDLWPFYNAIKVPTLVLHGERSDVLSAATAEAMTQRGPKARLITYQGVGHAPALMNTQQIGDVIGFLSN